MEKNLDLVKELKILRNLRVMVIPMVIGAFWMIPKNLISKLEEMEIKGPAETIKTTALMWSARIVRRVSGTWGDFQSLRLQWNIIRKCWCKKLANNVSRKEERRGLASIEDSIDVSIWWLEDKIDQKKQKQHKNEQNNND